MTYSQAHRVNSTFIVKQSEASSIRLNTTARGKSSIVHKQPHLWTFRIRDKPIVNPTHQLVVRSAPSIGLVIRRIGANLRRTIAQIYIQRHSKFNRIPTVHNTRLTFKNSIALRRKPERRAALIVDLCFLFLRLVKNGYPRFSVEARHQRTTLRIKHASFDLHPREGLQRVLEI